MLAARAFMMLFCITQQPVQRCSSCKIPSALSTADGIKSMYFYCYVDFMKAEAAFAVYSSCEIPGSLRME
jgi:hypothetical protein